MIITFIFLPYRTSVPKVLTYSKSPLVGYPSKNRTNFSNAPATHVGELVKATFAVSSQIILFSNSFTIDYIL